MAYQLPTRVLLGAFLALSSSSYGQNNSQPPGTQEKTASAPSGDGIAVGFDLHPKFAAILVKVEVNKKPAVMILDTGSSRTILDPRIVGLDFRELHRPVNVGKGSGISGDDSRWGKANLQVGTHLFRDHRVVVSDMWDVSRTFQQPIDGLLGQLHL
ncbi:MAG: retroviral-like aspartic protease family protein [Deltaproteobacteria bacterium]|nr:retroviral-like aspartic protease family protein [Deltaproteobacteria bacterium]